MNRKDLKECIQELPFEYVCKVKGNKNHLRYHYDKNEGYWFLLIINYTENSCSLFGHGKWPNERIESKFDYLYVHDLSKQQLIDFINIFIN
jgi:hypothetical protein